MMVLMYAFNAVIAFEILKAHAHWSDLGYDIANWKWDPFFPPNQSHQEKRGYIALCFFKYMYM